MCDTFAFFRWRHLQDGFHFGCAAAQSQTLTSATWTGKNRHKEGKEEEEEREAFNPHLEKTLTLTSPHGYRWTLIDC